jgi:hypothetical protein
MDAVQNVAHAEEALHQKMNSLALESDQAAATATGSDLRAIVIYDYQQVSIPNHRISISQIA